MKFVKRVLRNKIKKKIQTSLMLWLQKKSQDAVDFLTVYYPAECVPTLLWLLTA